MRLAGLAFALCFSGACAAQQLPTNPARTANTDAVSTSAADTDATITAASETPSIARVDQASNADTLAKHTLRLLPNDVPPNPPNPEDLTAAKRTWHGEYEADGIGLPLLGPDGRAMPVLYDKKGKRVKSKVKVPKTHPITIVAGTLTEDGWTGKARLNHDIPDLRYIYLSAPDVGTVIIAQAAFRGATEQKNAFSGSTLTVAAGPHQFQLASNRPLLGKHNASAWVKVDPTYSADARYPVMGYGSKLKPPYEWPGAKIATDTGAKDPPPLPIGMSPKLATNCSPRKPCASTTIATEQGTRQPAAQ